MRKSKLFHVFFVAIPLALACMGSNCNVSLEGNFDILDSVIETENSAHQSLAASLALYNQTIPDYQNLHWNSSNTAFVEWKRALEDLNEQLPKIQNAWNAATQADRDANQTRFEVSKSKVTLLLARLVNYKIVVEPWTVYLMTISKNEFTQVVPNVTAAAKAFFGAQLPTPAWTIEFMNDRRPAFNSAMGYKRFSVMTDVFCEGSGALARCPLPDKSLVALEGGFGGEIYLHNESQTTTIDLGWTTTPVRAVFFERAPGKTGPLTYNEPLALHVQGVGYIFYEHHDIGVSLSESSTPKYEWQIVPQWSQMSGQNVDAQLQFGLYNMVRKSFLGDCGQTFGADVGWSTEPDLINDNSFECE